MDVKTGNNFTANQGFTYFLWIIFAWTLYVLFVYPNLKNITFFPYKIIGESIRILIFAVPVLVLSYKLFDNPLEKLGISKNLTKGILVGLIIAIVWFSISVSIANKLQNKQLNFSNLNIAFWLTGFSVSTIVEELGFRSFLLQSLKSKGTYFSLIASSIAFVLIHYPGWILFDMMPNISVFLSASASIFILGLVLGIVFLRTKSIWAVVIIHAFNNLAAALLAVN